MGEGILVQEVPFATVKPLRARAALDRVAVKDAAGVRWWAGTFDGQLVAVGGLLMRGTWARMKSAWTAPAYRGRGIGRRIFLARMAVCQHECIPLVEVFSARPEFYLAEGFIVNGTHQHGATVLIRRL